VRDNEVQLRIHDSGQNRRKYADDKAKDQVILTFAGASGIFYESGLSRPEPFENCPAERLNIYFFNKIPGTFCPGERVNACV
jgi:hypothetical protein